MNLTAAAPAPAQPAQADALAPPSTPPGTPDVPQEIAALFDKPIFTGEYTATERDTWRKGLPLFGTKVHADRSVAFSNEFNVLRVPQPLAGYGAASLDDAIRKAREVAYEWSDPAIGGRIYSSVGVAVLQAADGNHFIALVGSGNPNTSKGALGYRSDRYDNNIYGNAKRAEDLRATSSWSAPVDRDGNPVDVPAPSDDAAVNRRHLVDQQIERFVPASDALKAVVDIKNVYRIGS